MADCLQQIGLGREIDRFLEALNHGAEAAAKEAKPIFPEAVKSITINDAWGILSGVLRTVLNGKPIFQTFQQRSTMKEPGARYINCWCKDRLYKAHRMR